MLGQFGQEGRDQRMNVRAPPQLSRRTQPPPAVRFDARRKRRKPPHSVHTCISRRRMYDIHTCAPAHRVPVIRRSRMASVHCAAASRRVNTHSEEPVSAVVFGGLSEVCRCIDYYSPILCSHRVYVQVQPTKNYARRVWLANRHQSQRGNAAVPERTAASVSQPVRVAAHA